MHSLWMTVGFSKLHPYVGFLRSYNCFLLYIAPCSAGKAADMSAPESSHRGASKGQNMPDTTLLYPLSAGLERGKARSCREEQDNVKGAFFRGMWEGMKSKYI